MSKTNVKGSQIKDDTVESVDIKDGTITNDDINITTAGKALVTKVLVDDELTIVSTGVDTGTGVVTIGLGDIDPKRITCFEFSNSEGTSSTGGGGWSTKLQVESPALKAGNYQLSYCGEKGQSDEGKRAGLQLQYRINATGGWISETDVRDGVSVDDQYQTEKAFSRLITVAENDTIEFRARFGQADDGGTARLRRFRLNLERKSV